MTCKTKKNGFDAQVSKRIIKWRKSQKFFRSRFQIKDLCLVQDLSSNQDPPEVYV